MLKYLVSLVLVIFIPALSSADLNSFMWAQFPAEKHNYLVNDKTGSYETNAQFGAIGDFYISLEHGKIIFKGLQPIMAHAGLTNGKYEFFIEEFKVTKVIKVDESNYAFEGRRVGIFERQCSGSLRIRKTSPQLAEIVSFDMTEKGQTYKGVMNRYTLPKSKTAKAMLEEFDTIYFGNNYAAMGPEEQIQYDPQ